MSLEELDGSLMFLRRFFGLKGAEISPFACLGVFFP